MIYNNRTTNDKKAFEIIKDKFINDYDELYESLYYYMKTYIEGNLSEKNLFRDEIENYLNISNHEEIVQFIINI